MRANNFKKAAVAENLCVIVLMFMFSSAILLILAMGTGGYRSITKGMNQNYSIRTSLSYVATKIRQGDKINQVSVKKFSNANSLVIEEDIEGVLYQTWIYPHDGAIYEMFSEKETEFKPQDGMRIMDIAGFDIKQINSSLFSLTASDKSGKTEELMVATRT